MIMDEHLTFKIYMWTLKLKLNKANGLLAKLRHYDYVNLPLLRTIYYSTMPFFNPTCNIILKNTEKIQNKVLRILNFKNPWDLIEQIYKESKFLN